MIERLSHATIYVLDQDSALAFYRDKLGFEVRTDQTMGEFRWLTVGPPEQKDLELILMKPQVGPMFDEQDVAALRSLIEKGKMGAGVMYTSDCQKTYQELSARGVEFIQPPTEKFYGIEALMRDDSGNWFSVTQRTE